MEMGYLHHVKESTQKLHGYVVKLSSLQWRIPHVTGIAK